MEQMTFDEVMVLTRTVSGPAAFEDNECRAYYDLLAALQPGSVIVEIGLQFGRSSSIALQVAKARGLIYCGVDPFTDPPEAKAEWIKMRDRICYFSCLYPNKTKDVAAILPTAVDLALVDGDHLYDGVATDCQVLMPRIVRGGYLLFHDYGRESLPEVYSAAQAALAPLKDDWEELPTVGTLGIWRRK